MRIRSIISVIAVVFLAATMAILPAPSGHAAELAGVTMPDTRTIGGKTASLVGMGIRTKTFIGIKVYVAGLYMANPSTDADDITGSDQAKAMVMKFLYKKVEGEKLQNGWREGFDNNTPEASADLQKRMDRFVSLFTESALKGDEYVFAYEPGRGTTVTLKGNVRETIPGADFGQALMAIWFGDKLSDGGLKKLKKSILKGLK